MYEIVFFDLDGTLRDEAHGIPDSARQALARCRKNGCRVCLCTGRSIGTIPEDAAALAWDGVIAGNGCYIALGGEVLRDAGFEPSHVQTALCYLREQAFAAFAFETPQTVFMNGQAAQILRRMTAEKWKGLSQERRRAMHHAQKIDYRDNLDAFIPAQHKTGKICLWAGETVRTRVWRILAGEPPKLCQDAAWENGQRYWEIIRADCDKGDAIKLVCAHFGIARSRALAFGDGRNDIDMFRAAGTAVAMAGGDNALKAHADCWCEAPMDNGIYLELSRRHMI